MPDTVPAPVRPANGPFTALTQASPRGQLPADVRESLAEFSEANPNWAGTIIVPGDTTHWIQLSAQEIVSFQSFLTFRIVEALGSDGVLDIEAATETLTRPERLAAHLRSAELEGTNALGPLIGAELAATRAFWLGADVRILGAGPLADAYEGALKAQSAFASKI